MRHLARGRKLGRNATHRQALLRSLACRLFEHERIITTLAKAKEVRPYAEKLITVAKKALPHMRAAEPIREDAERFPEDSKDRNAALARWRQTVAPALHFRRRLIAVLQDRKIVSKLLDEIAPRFEERPGGYTRVLKRTQRRLGDASPTAFIELLKADEKKTRRGPKPKVASQAKAPAEAGAEEET